MIPGISLAELKQNGMFPSNMPDDVIIKICKNIGMKNINNMNSKLTNFQIDKLNFSKELNDVRIKNTITNKHKEVIDMFDDLIEKYNNVINQIDHKDLSNEKTELKKLVAQIKADKNEYEKQTIKYKGFDHDKFIDVGQKNVVFQKINNVVKDIDDIHEMKSSNLDLDYDKLENEYKNMESNLSNNIFVKKAQETKMKMIANKMKRIHEKKGRIQSRQRQIISSNTDLYIRYAEQRFKDYNNAYNKTNEKAKQKSNILSEIDNLNNTVSEKNKLYYNLETQKQNQKFFKRIATSNMQKKIQKENEKMKKTIERLQKKSGEIKVVAQKSR